MLTVAAAPRGSGCGPCRWTVRFRWHGLAAIMRGWGAASPARWSGAAPSSNAWMRRSIGRLRARRRSRWSAARRASARRAWWPSRPNGRGRAELARLLPELGRPRMLEEDGQDGRSVQAQLFELVLGLLERLAARAPLLLILEDLHWADRSSLELLAFLAHGLGDAPVALLATYRSDELHRRHRLRPLLADLDRSHRADRFELVRLSRGELAELLAGRLGRQPEPEVLEGILRRSEGNPLFAEELLEAELRDDAATLPATLQDLLAVRVETLSDPARQVLRLAALVGRRVGHRLLAAACSLEQDVLLGRCGRP